MKTAICSFCLKSGILCQKCLAKLKSGEVSELDLRIVRLLSSLAEKHPSLQNIHFRNAIEADKTLAIIVGPGDVPRLLGYGGKIIKALSKKTGKSIPRLPPKFSWTNNCKPLQPKTHPPSYSLNPYRLERNQERNKTF